ncbi:hypothetical protein [Xanthomonas theicola]|uniref:hypothetical protein n=1 Tax=Xanthomonas theicola TaxID=56464 RepID=UPI000FF8895D|nr:hypothetical protein [Xanthomonas theicola]QNH25224.1 hypothetical protein G4Q83_11405 [Xanthomonas theicola]
MAAAALGFANACRFLRKAAAAAAEILNPYAKGGEMHNISAVDPQEIVDQIDALSASKRVHKTPLALALKDVKRAHRSQVEFSPEQAYNIADGMGRAFGVLSEQNSNMEENKLDGLLEMAVWLQYCFTHSIDKASGPITAAVQISKARDNLLPPDLGPLLTKLPGCQARVADALNLRLIQVHVHSGFPSPSAPAQGQSDTSC